MQTRAQNKNEKLTLGLTGRDALSHASSISQLWPKPGTGTTTPLGRGKGKAKASSPGLPDSDQDNHSEYEPDAEEETPFHPEGSGPPANDQPPEGFPQGDNPNGGGNGGGGGGGGGGNGGGGDDNDDNDEDDDGGDNNPNPQLDTNLLLADAIQNLNRGLRKLQRPSSTKVKDPEPFDGTNPNKLREFLVSCSLVFSDRPDSFRKDEKMVRYVISYLKGPALDWFEPVIMGDVDDIPNWLSDFNAFVKELTDHFGPYDFRGDAETSLNNLAMKDHQRITRYIVDFNKLAARTEWNEPALRDRFYRGLPARIRTELLRGGKPTTLIRMRLKAQQVDQAYWMTKDELSKETKAHPSDSKKDDAKSAPSKKPYTPASDSNNRSAPNSGSRFQSSASASSSSKTPSSKKPDISDKLGKDGKLKNDERKRRMEKNLCLYCGAGGHSAKDCRKASSARGRAAVASSSTSDAVEQPKASEPSGSKK